MYPEVQNSCSLHYMPWSLPQRTCNLDQIKLKGFRSQPHWEPLSKLDVKSGAFVSLLLEVTIHMVDTHSFLLSQSCILSARSQNIGKHSSSQFVCDHRISVLSLIHI